MRGIFIPDCTQEEIAETLMYARKGANNCMIGVRKHYISVEDTELPRWIPISERLPEEKINPYTNDFDEVLCTTDWGEVVALKFGTPLIHNKPHFWLGGSIMDEHIIAWQYKPEPYKEGGAE